MKYSGEKQKNAILYFLEHANNPTLGKTKLLKLLYFLDFGFFEKHGKSVTGDTYRKLNYGPVAEHSMRLLDEMELSGEVTRVPTQAGPYEQTRYVHNVRADLSVFNGAELEELENVARAYADYTGSQVAQITHEEAPWKATEEGEEIDYRLAWYRRPEDPEQL